MVDEEMVDENVKRYRLERSRRVMEVNPHAAQMDVALEENADVNVMRGPNSIITTLLMLPFSLNELDSNFNPSFSNVSRNNHSSRCVEVVSSTLSFSSCTLKQDSVSIDRIFDASSALFGDD